MVRYRELQVRSLNITENKPILTITKAEIEYLLKLYTDAQNTPVIKFSSDPNEKDQATLAYDRVREFQQELGKKYNYDWEKHAINGKGEVIPV